MTVISLIDKFDAELGSSSVFYSFDKRNLLASIIIIASEVMNESSIGGHFLTD